MTVDVVAQGSTVDERALLSNGSADLALCHPGNPSEGKPEIVSLRATLHERLVLVQSARLTTLAAEDLFVRTFAGTLWLCLLGTLALLAAGLRACTTWEKHPWGYAHLAFWAVAVACQQGLSAWPRSSTGRAVYLLAYAATYLLNTALTAAITSLLASGPSLQSTHKIHRGLPPWSGRLACTSEVRATHSACESIEITLQDALARVHAGGWTLLASAAETRAHLRTIPSKQSRRYKITVMEGRPLSLLARHNTSLTNSFDYWLTRLHETGLLHLELERSLHRWPYGFRTDKDAGIFYASAGLHHLGSAVLLLLAGWITAVICLTVELVWTQCTRTQTKTKTPD